MACDRLFHSACFAAQWSRSALLRHMHCFAGGVTTPELQDLVTTARQIREEARQSVALFRLVLSVSSARRASWRESSPTDHPGATESYSERERLIRTASVDAHGGPPLLDED